MNKLFHAMSLCVMWGCLLWLVTDSGLAGFCDGYDGGSLSIVYGHSGCHVNNMPLEIRDVPVHRDDAYAIDHQGPVVQTKYDTHPSVAFSIMNWWKCGATDRFRYGIGFDWIISNSDEEERNYTSAPGTSQRGYGAALTYVMITQRGIFKNMYGSSAEQDFLNITPRVQMEASPFKNTLERLQVGIGLSYYSVTVESGWDRYDEHDPRRNDILMRVFPVEFYVKWTVPYRGEHELDFGLTAGVKLQPNIKTDLGERADISADPATWFVGWVNVFN